MSLVVDASGNLVYSTWTDVSPVTGLHGPVLCRVRISTWPDGSELWRVLRSPTLPRSVAGRGILRLRFVHRGYPETMGYVENAYPAPDGSMFQVEIPSLKFDPSKVRDLLDKERWVLPMLGLLSPGVSPLPTTVTTSEDNPWIGSFKGRTVEEVRADAADADLFLSRQPMQHVDPILVRRPYLFADETHLLRVFVGMDVQRHSTLLPRPLYEFELLRPIDGTLGPRWQTVAKCGSRTVAGIVDWMMDREPLHRGELQHPSWRVLPAADAEAWWQQGSDPGSLTLPADEVEVYRLVGEKLPLLWPFEQAERWAIERWGSP